MKNELFQRFDAASPVWWQKSCVAKVKTTVNRSKGSAMQIVESGRIGDYKRMVRAFDRESGLKAIVAIHNTRRGPALG